MNPIFRVVIISMMSTLLTFAVSAAEVDVSSLPDQVLSGEKAKEILAGNGLTGMSRGYRTQISLQVDGSLRGASAGFLDTGKWVIEGDLVCMRWDRQFPNTCRSAEIKGGLLYLKDSSGSFVQQK